MCLVSALCSQDGKMNVEEEPSGDSSGGESGEEEEEEGEGWSEGGPEDSDSPDGHSDLESDADSKDAHSADGLVGRESDADSVEVHAQLQGDQRPSPGERLPRDDQAAARAQLPYTFAGWQTPGVEVSE